MSERSGRGLEIEIEIEIEREGKRERERERERCLLDEGERVWEGREAGRREMCECKIGAASAREAGEDLCA